jgi:predicted solute-binding protein
VTQYYKLVTLPPFFKVKCVVKSKTKKSREAEAFNLTPRYIDDVLPINNTSFAYWIPLIEIS